MLNCNSNFYPDTMPEIVVNMNCDTVLAINLKFFGLGEYDEFIFAIKNYDYKDSPYVFLFRARSGDENEKGEVIFKIPAAESTKLKSGAFYNFAIIKNAFNEQCEPEYEKLTDNGKIRIEYGAQAIS